MKRKIFKIVSIVFIVLLIFNIYITNTNESMALTDVTENPNIWVRDESEGEMTINVKLKPILTLIRIVGTIASVITLSIIALRIVLGSVEEKAAYKQTLVPWLVGAFMLFSMTTIPSVVYDFIGENKMSGTVEVLSDAKIPQLYCINGNEMVYVPSSNNYTCSSVSGCTCKGAFVQGYKCPRSSCSNRRLVDYGKYWYCEKCNIAYSK